MDWSTTMGVAGDPVHYQRGQQVHSSWDCLWQSTSCSRRSCLSTSYWPYLCRTTPCDYDLSKPTHKSTSSCNLFTCTHDSWFPCTHVFVCRDSVKKPLQSPYDGPFRVICRTPKYYHLEMYGKSDTVSIDRLKPAHVNSSMSQVSDSFWHLHCIYLSAFFSTCCSRNFFDYIICFTTDASSIINLSNFITRATCIICTTCFYQIWSESSLPSISPRLTLSLAGE